VAQLEQRKALEAIGSRITTAYRVPGFLAVHYEPGAAIAQKLAALVGRPHTQARSVGEISLHHVSPRFFGGFEVHPSGAKLATPEKALLDVAYLGASKTRLFTRLPELELPSGFKPSRANEWLERIEAGRMRERTRTRFQMFVGQAS
jgi:hypothetical protein